MWCPRCKSTRIQRGYNDSSIVFQMAGLHELLCNNCGLEFKGFDPLRRLKRAPAKHSEKRITDRRFPRYKVHLPAAISLVERNPLPLRLPRCSAVRSRVRIFPSARHGQKFGNCSGNQILHYTSWKGNM